MLQLQTKANDICRISKLLVKYNIKASITNSVITLEGDVSDELLTQLCSGIDINAVQNFISQEPLYVPKETSFIKSEERIPTEVVDKPQQVEATVVEETENVETTQTTPTLSHHPSEYDLLYSEVKRGEVYLCDFGEPYGSEQGKIDISLHLSREVKTIVNPEAPKERKDVNMVQVQLLSFVDINELLKISQSYSSDDIKAQKILELFGFNFKKNGVQYLLKAIIASLKSSYFNLETLSESVSKTEGIEKEEVKRLIIARVKETFGFRKAPTIDFIRLVNNFLVKQEEV